MTGRYSGEDLQQKLMEMERTFDDLMNDGWLPAVEKRLLMLKQEVERFRRRLQTGDYSRGGSA